MTADAALDALPSLGLSAIAARSVWITATVFVLMVIETRLALRNERFQFARGGVESTGDVYAWIRIVYPGMFLAMIAEGALQGHHLESARPLILGIVVFGLGKMLKWWAIATLGRFWTFRIIVVPGSTLIASGPYRLFRHPNYVGVIGEIVGVALMTGARVTGPLSLLVFGALIVRRVAVENRALDAILRRG